MKSHQAHAEIDVSFSRRPDESGKVNKVYDLLLKIITLLTQTARDFRSNAVTVQRS